MSLLSPICCLLPAACCVLPAVCCSLLGVEMSLLQTEVSHTLLRRSGLRTGERGAERAATQPFLPSGRQGGQWMNQKTNNINIPAIFLFFVAQQLNMSLCVSHQ